LVRRKFSIGWVCALFFCSGVPALIYQIVWQRALFTIFGTNVQAMTAVVAAFMLGLGLGSLSGGLLSQRPGAAPVRMFAAVELAIGTFGIFSLWIFRSVAAFTAGVPAGEAGVIAFALLLIPTFLMGSTLPILVSHLVRISESVGRAVGLLYFANTLGSAAACLVAAAFAMRTLGESGSVAVAAAMNFAIGFVVLFLTPRAGSVNDAEGPAAGPAPALGLANERLAMPVAGAVAALAGFIALGYEVVWYRVYSFLSESWPVVLTAFLGVYLAGIALGSFGAVRFLRGRAGETPWRKLRTIANLLVLASLAGYMVAPSIAFAAGSGRGHHRLLFALCIFPPGGLGAVLLGAIFPLVADVSVAPDTRAGGRLSYIYLSNIAGSTLGTLLIGYAAMDRWPLQQVSTLIACGGLIGGMGLMAFSRMSLPRLGATILAVFVAGAAAVLVSLPVYSRFYERLWEKGNITAGHRFKYVVENKSGVIAVTADDRVLGGGHYEGAYSTGLIHDRNGIFRAFSLSLWHAAPREVLQIGLSSGSWAQVIASHPQLHKLTIIEINPGYLELIPRYPEVASLLRNPKVEVDIDDGRRWLTRNRDARFDIIVMNTPANWRAQATNMLSVEFLQLAKKHLKPAGVLFYNTTDSGEVQVSGLRAFRYGFMLQRFLVVSDSPVTPDPDRWRRVLTSYRIDGRPVLRLDQEPDRQRLEELMSLHDVRGRPLITESAQLQRRVGRKRPVTDDNMGTEWNLPRRR